MTTPYNLEQIATYKIGNYKNKPTIIFLHDSLGCIELWRDFPEKLSNLTKCNAIVYDRQGYGKSLPFTKDRDVNYLELEADILMQLISLWGVEKPILFGHSDGGSIALIAAAKYPNKIKAIITEGAHIFVEDITLNGINNAIELYKTTNLKSKLKKYHGTKTDTMFWAWAKTWTTKKFKNWNIEHFLPHIECKSLVIQGEDDEYGTLNQVYNTIKATKTLGKKLILPNIKHTPHKENPDLILKETAAFIATI
ncbi:alpha/beta hydrolase [Cellulophaga lytica]|uniref:alpha/beta fold hydrolase n=1 Tax=Cellulophaga lytica TaxID=979 RepID=UPI0032E404B3